MSASMPEKRLYRSRSEKMLFGVTAGLGDYFETDPTIVRLVFVLLCFLGGAGILLYIALAIMMPEEPATTPESTIANSASGAGEFSERISETAREIGERARKLGEEANAAFSSAGESASAEGENIGQRVADAAKDVAQRAEQLGEEVRSSVRAEETAPTAPSRPSGGRRRPRQLIGLVLLLLGAIFLLDNLGLFWWWNWDWMWPMVIIGLGLFLLANNARSKGER